MKYKGIELKEVTEPQLFDQPKKMLVLDSDYGCLAEFNVYAIVNRKNYRVITENAAWRHCAEIPKVPELELVTYRELARWLAEGNGEVNDELDDDECAIYTHLFYWKGRENDAVGDSLNVRKWDDTEWHKPTREYLGLED